ncbi:MAG: transketolase family protein [Oscillospiraceae bacterium]|nr:transketolase family protein [Oscillospiraceae bacterium]
MSEKKATRNAYGEALVELGAVNDKVVVLDADLAPSVMTNGFAKQFPDRYFNTGIAEANMVDMSAGLSTMGFIPFCSTFAIFGAGRVYEMVRNSVAYPRFNVKLGMTHAGITVGEDGSSHQSIEDIALMRVIPNMTVIVPCDANEAKKATFAAAEMDGPVYLRFARPSSYVFEEDMPFEIGKANVLRDGDDGVIFACGLMVKPAVDAADALKEQGKNISVVNVHTIKPLDKETVLKYATRCKKVLTIEEHSVIGGLGDAVADAIIGHGDFSFRKLGIQDQFGQSGTPAQLLEVYGLSDAQILEAAKEMF